MDVCAMERTTFGELSSASASGLGWPERRA